MAKELTSAAVGVTHRRDLAGGLRGRQVGQRLFGPRAKKGGWWPGPLNGLELSCPAAQTTVDSLWHILTGRSPSNFPHASRVSCSELLGALQWLVAFEASTTAI